MKPFLRWAGGKRWIISTIKELINGEKKEIQFDLNKNFYFEPFMGAGAVFFDLMPKQAVLVDLNDELINLMKVIKTNPDKLIQLMEDHKNKFQKFKSNYYYEIRNLDRSQVIFSRLTNVEKASRTLFLNRTCWNGLYRVNQKNQFNTPIGFFSENVILGIVQKEKIKEASIIYNKNSINFISGDYSLIENQVKEGDLIYFDPPYDPINKNSFITYTSKGFTKNNQKELKEFCDKMIKKGANVIISNSDTEFIRNLYLSEDNIYKYNVIYKSKYPTVARVINSKIEKRGKVQELLIYSVKNSK